MRVLFAVAAVSLLLIASFSMTATAQIEQSEKTVGDRWTYDFEWHMDEYLLTGEVEYEVKGTTEVLGYDVYTVSTEGSGSLSGAETGTWEIAGTTHKRISDHATVKDEGTVSMTFLYLGETVTLSMEKEETNIPPLDLGDYPIELHENWSASTTRTSTKVWLVNGIEESWENETGPVTYSMECLRERTVTVPAGTFTGYEIKFTRDDDSFMIEVISLDLVATVISEDFGSDGTKLGTMELVSYSVGQEEGLGEFELFFLIAILVTAGVMIAGVAASVARRRRMEEQPSLYDHKKERPPW